MIIISLVITSLVIILFFTLKTNKNSIPNNYTSISNYPIKYKEFRSGYLIDPDQRLANVCATDNMIKNRVLYPINPPYVNYGDYGCDVNTCPTVRFNEVP